MDNSALVLIGMAAVLAAGLFAVAVYKWRQRRRVARVEEWVKHYLAARGDGLPSSLHIDCSDDRLWPVLVDFADLRTGIRHRLRFDCPGSGTSLSLLMEERDPR